ncbi:MAG TPA: phage portal protein [Methylomicrobium sp.]|nr:phage portal protein [Methylomicrobium sp.]
MLDKTPGSPDWFLDRLVRKILSRQPRYDSLENYMVGKHPLPGADKRSIRAFEELQRKARTNYFGLVTMAPVERMQVVGFRFGATEGSDDDAAKMWQANDMEYQSSLLHMVSATFGDAYVLVSPPKPGGNGLPVFTVEDPRFCAVEMDPSNPTRVAIACRMWNDNVTGKTVAMIATDEYIRYYVAQGVGDVDPSDTPTLTSRLLESTSTSFTLTSAVPNPIGICPIVRFSWRMSFSDSSLGEAEDVIDVQDRINSEILNRLIISRSQAYKQRLITGVKIPEDKGRGKKPPFDPGADMLWVVADPNVSIHEFKEADIRQILDAVRDDVTDMAAITKTPPHYLLGEVVNVSGDALKAAETGLVSKTRIRMTSMGWSWEKVLRVAFRYLGDSRATEVIASVIWADPESKSRAELADAMTKEVSAGVPLALAMQRARFTPEEIKFAVAEQRKAEARQAALAAAAAPRPGASQQPRQNSPGVNNATTTG